MEKDFALKSNPNTQYCYDFLLGLGYSDQNIDGVAETADGKVQANEVFTLVFQNFQKYSPSQRAKLTEHFVKLGLKEVKFLQPDGQFSSELRNLIKQELSLNHHAEQVKEAVDDPQFASHFLKQIYDYSQFALLGYEEQKELLTQYVKGLEGNVDKTQIQTQVLAQLKQRWSEGRTIAKTLAQAALVKGLELEDMAKALKEKGQDEAGSLLQKTARGLFQACVEMDGQNTLARRRLATYLFKEGRKEEAGLHLGQAVEYEFDLEELLKLGEHFKNAPDSAALWGNYGDSWSFIGGHLMKADRYRDAAEIYEQAARDTDNVELASRFKDKALIAGEAGHPYSLSFDPKDNPPVYGLYQSLRDHNIPSALIWDPKSSQAAERQISVENILRYLDQHLDDPRVQAALEAKGLTKLPWMDEQGNLKPEYANDTFQHLTFTQRLAYAHGLKAGDSSGSEAELHLRYAIALDPHNAHWKKELGDFQLGQKNYSGALEIYQQASAIDPSDVAIQVSLGQAHYGLGQFKEASEAYSVYLAKNPRDTKILRFRLESNQRYSKTLEKSNDPQLSSIKSEIHADQARLFAINAPREKKKLADLEERLEDLHDSDQKKQLMAVLEVLGKQYLTMAELPGTDPQEVQWVRQELNGLATEVFGVISRFAKKDSDPEIQSLATVYEAYDLLASGKIDDAVKILEVLRKENPESGNILNHLKRDHLRLTNLAAIESWEVYNKEVEAQETDEANGILGKVEDLFRSDHSNQHTDIANRWQKERSLVEEIKTRLSNGHCVTIEEALRQLRDSSKDSWLSDRAKYFLEDPKRYSKDGHPLSYVIDYVSKNPPESGVAQALLRMAFKLECDRNAVQFPFALYSLVNALSPDTDIRDQAQFQMKALQGNSSFELSSRKFLSRSIKDLPVEIGLFFVAAGLGNMAKISMLAKYEKAAMAPYQAFALASAAGIGVEGTALWAGHVGKEAMTHDVSKVFTAEHLTKSYGANLLLVAGLKGVGKFSETMGPRAARGLGLITEDAMQLTAGGKVLVWGIGHGAGLGGMIATSYASQALGLKESPLGGWKEGLVEDVFSYVEFAVAHKLADRIFGGKMTAVGQKQYSEIAWHEAVMRAKRQADGLGLKAEKGPDGKIIDSPERRDLVAMLVEASLSRPGFSGGRLSKLIEKKEHARINDYFKEFKLPLQLAEDGHVIPVASQKLSPHEAEGITPEQENTTPVTPSTPEDIITPVEIPEQAGPKIEDVSLDEIIEKEKPSPRKGPAPFRSSDKAAPRETSSLRLLAKAQLTPSQGPAIFIKFDTTHPISLGLDSKGKLIYQDVKKPVAKIRLTQDGKPELFRTGKHEVTLVDSTGTAYLQNFEEGCDLSAGDVIRIGKDEMKWEGYKVREVSGPSQTTLLLERLQGFLNAYFSAENQKTLEAFLSQGGGFTPHATVFQHYLKRLERLLKSRRQLVKKYVKSQTPRLRDRLIQSDQDVAQQFSQLLDTPYHKMGLAYDDRVEFMTRETMLLKIALAHAALKYRRFGQGPLEMPFNYDFIIHPPEALMKYADARHPELSFTQAPIKDMLHVQLKVDSWEEAQGILQEISGKLTLENSRGLELDPEGATARATMKFLGDSGSHEVELQFQVKGESSSHTSSGPRRIFRGFLGGGRVRNTPVQNLKGLTALMLGIAVLAENNIVLADDGSVAQASQHHTGLWTAAGIATLVAAGGYGAWRRYRNQQSYPVVPLDGKEQDLLGIPELKNDNVMQALQTVLKETRFTDAMRLDPGQRLEIFQKIMGNFGRVVVKNLQKNHPTLAQSLPLMFQKFSKGFTPLEEPAAPKLPMPLQEPANSGPHEKVIHAKLRRRSSQDPLGVQTTLRWLRKAGSKLPPPSYEHLFYSQRDPRLEGVEILIAGQQLLQDASGKTIFEAHIYAGGEEGQKSLKFDDGSLASAKTSKGGRSNQEDGVYLSRFTLADGTEVKILAGADGAGGMGRGELASSAFLQGIHARVVEAANEGKVPLAGELFVQGVKAVELQKDHAGIRASSANGAGSVVVIVGNQMTVASAGDSMVTVSRKNSTGEYESVGYSHIDNLEPSLITNGIGGKTPDHHPNLYTLELKAGDRVSIGSDGLWENILGTIYKTQGSKLMRLAYGTYGSSQSTFQTLNAFNMATVGHGDAASLLHDLALSNIQQPGQKLNFLGTEIELPQKKDPDNIFSISYEHSEIPKSPQYPIPSTYQEMEPVEEDAEFEIVTSPELHFEKRTLPN